MIISVQNSPGTTATCQPMTDQLSLLMIWCADRVGQMITGPPIFQLTVLRDGPRKNARQRLSTTGMLVGSMIGVLNGMDGAVSKPVPTDSRQNHAPCSWVDQLADRSQL